MVSVLIVIMIGSFVASFLPEQAMSGTMQIAMIIIGLRFLLKPVTTTKEQLELITPKNRVIKAIVGGIFVGFICGFAGVGGGMMLCVVFTLFWARIAAKIANKSDAKILNRVVGIVMIAISNVILVVNYI